MYISVLISILCSVIQMGKNFRLEMKLSVCKIYLFENEMLNFRYCFQNSITTYYMALESKWRMRRVYFAHGNMK